MAAPFDNSQETNLENLSNHIGEGVVIDVGTGDGRFVSAAAKANPNKFFIGIDANVKPLEKPSMKATRRPNKGGLPNALFVQAAVEDLPEELDGVADEIHIHFPWGSLLGALATGDGRVLSNLRRIGSPQCIVEIVIGIDPERDRAEFERLGVASLTVEYIHHDLRPKYENAGFRLVDCGMLSRANWSALETSWARKLNTGDSRTVIFMIFHREP